MSYCSWYERSPADKWFSGVFWAKHYARHESTITEVFQVIR